MTTNQHATKLLPTYGESPINIRRNSDQHTTKLQATYGDTPIWRDFYQHTARLRTTSIPTPDNIRPKSEQHRFQLRTTSVQTSDNIRSNSEQEMIRLSNLKPSAACVSVGMRGCHLHKKYFCPGLFSIFVV